MEVIFAIGVILAGLVGIAALIPVAANNAKATLELDRSISESTSAAAAGVARSFYDLDSLVIFDKPTAESEPYFFGGTTGPASFQFGYMPANSMRTIGWKVNIQSNYHPPFSATTGTVEVFGKLETPGYGHHDRFAGLVSAICIDPLGMPDPNLVSPALFSPVNQADSAFDYSRFPYYGERYEVLSAPNTSIGTQPPPTIVTPATGPPVGKPVWPMSPRMWRATIRSPLYPDNPPNLPEQRHQLMASATLRQIFSGSGGLAKLGAPERDNPLSVVVSRSTTAGNVIDSATDSSTQYSWFATLVPPFSGGDTFRQSIVVVRRRLPPVPQRAGDPLALSKNTSTITDAADNPDAERLTWVGDAIGFQGGVGGEVLLYGSQAISDEISSGEWVMLSRQPHLVSVPPAPPSPSLPTGPAVHRWYRVLRVGESEQISGYSWPGGTHDVWRRWVTLAGPDWVFQDGDTTPIDDTFCTIVTGAVSVIESEVVIR